MNHFRLLHALAVVALVAANAPLAGCRRSSSGSSSGGGGGTQLPADAAAVAVSPNLNNPMVRTPPPAGGTPVVRRDDGVIENCPILVSERCYATPREACAAAGCTGVCTILETYPGQVSCR